MVDILLIQPPIADFYMTAKRSLPYGLASIAAATRRQGFSTAILDGLATGKSRVVALPDELTYLKPFYGRPDHSPFALFHRYRHHGYSLEHIGNRVRASGASLVGIASLFTAYSDMALAVARTVKAHWPGCTVVVGGHHATALPAAVMGEPAVDLVLRGEGEVGLPALAVALRDGAPLDTVPGIVFRRPDGSLHRSPPALFSDPDALPLPAIDLVRRSHYRRFGRDSLVVTAGRGCPLACSYCATGANSWLGYRRRSVAAVLREIRASSAGRRVGFIDFEDENLSMDRRWLVELLEGIGAIFGSDLPELRAMNGLYPPTLTAEVVRALRRYGFKSLNLSLGSADPDQLRRFNRPNVRPAFERALVHARAEGLGAVGYIIVAAPDQDPLVSVEDLLFLACRPVLAGVSVFYPAPGSVDYERCRTRRLLPESFFRLRATALPIDQRTSRTDAVTLLRLGRILNFIKSLVGAGVALPPPAPAAERIPPGADWRQTGVRLLAAFLHDGCIRGVMPDGRVYRHQVSNRLCRRFLAGIAARPVRGVRR